MNIKCNNTFTSLCRVTFGKGSIIACYYCNDLHIHLNFISYMQFTSLKSLNNKLHSTIFLNFTFKKLRLKKLSIV